jgi:N4-gp56 family major capsid protein
MTAFVTTITGTSALDNSLVALYSDIVYFAAIPSLIADQFAVEHEMGMSKTLDISTYGDITVDGTTELTEANDPDSDVLSDSYVRLTPAEVGNVVTKTRLAELQTGGKINVAVPKAIGRAMGQKLDKMALYCLGNASPSATVYAGSATAYTNVTAPGSVADRSFVNKMYSKLARRDTPGLPSLGGLYAIIAHDDVIADVRDDAGAGAWIDVLKYKSPETVLRNEVGQFGGFVWFRDNNNSPTFYSYNDANGTIDAYKTLAFGDDVLIKGATEKPHLGISGPFDKMGRFLNVFWYGVIDYATLDANNMVHGVSASNFGSNT